MNARGILPAAVFARTREPNEISGAVRLRALEWALLFALTGRHTAGELGRQMRVEPGDRDAALARLLGLGLIMERDLDAAEYVRALATSGDQEEKSLREFLTMATQLPVAVDPRVGSATVPDRVPSPDAERTVAQGTAPGAPAGWTRPTTPVAESTPAAPVRVERPPRPAFGFQPLPLPPQEPRKSQPMQGTRRLSLRAVMNLIESQAVSREAGQLDIYRVFVRVDTRLLKRNGIETLRFTEDRLVADPELEQAIVRSVKKTLGLICPESVWVAGLDGASHSRTQSARPLPGGPS